MKQPILIITVSCSLLASAQNQLGIRTSNYSGVNSALINPAAFHHSALQWDFNIVSGGAFVYNQYAYVENASVISLIGHDGPMTFRSASADAPADDPTALYYNFYDQQAKFSNSVNAFVTGPSILLHKGKYSFGIFNNLRVASSGNRLDPDLDYFSLDRWVDGDTKEFDPFNINGMAWGEIGINVATTLKKDLRSELNIGINAKYLMGFEAFYFRNQNNTSVTALGDTSLVDGGPIDYAITSGNGFGINGHGFSGDIGVVYKRRKGRGKPYLWKLGVSLLDLGFVHFNKNSQKHILDESSLYNIDRNNLGNGAGVDALLDDLSLEALGDATQSQVADDFTLLTPSALSVQFDYALNKNWFLNATVNRRINFHPITVDRENFWSASVRYETKWFEMGMPVVLYDDRHLRVGTWIRIWGLTIGSDHINSILLKQPQLAGSDIYFALRVNSLTNPFGKKSGQRRRSQSAEDCYF